MAYNWSVNLKSKNFSDKSVLIIGAGPMAENYALALSNMKISDVSIIAMTETHVKPLCEKYKFKPLIGGFAEQLPKVAKKDLIVVAIPIPLLVAATKAALDSGQTNILVEKPVTLYKQDIINLKKIVSNQRVRVGYNRLLYPNYQKLKELITNEGGITSCFYTFTEWTHTFDFKKYGPEVLRRWGIANTLHVISTVYDLIGMPADLHSVCSGSFDWHPSGAVFTGSGLTTTKVPFSYHANWKSAGRWGIDVMTEQNAYRLMPMEDLQVCKKGTVNWEKVPFETAYPGVKFGIAEEIAAMLSGEEQGLSQLTTLDRAAEFISIAETIFGYESKKKK